MGIIRIMDEHVANQIAAGEVVERPASVVKELVENAIDAGSRRIEVAIEDGGLKLIRVKDDGCGMDGDDAVLAFQRHATSKIRTGSDLFRVRSLGFRGEALPSIAAVARVECVTSTAETGLGCRVVVEGGRLAERTAAAASRGTDVIVRDLFYNTPARLKYMKTVQTELGHVSDYIYRLAFSRPDIAITFKHNGSVLLQTPGGGDLLQVIAAVYGTAAAKQMVEVKGTSLDYRLSGYCGRPEVTRASRSGITFILNGRYIRNYALAGALVQAYHTLLPVNRYPLAVLHIQMEPELVDVNVHPSKLEVRFSKEAELTEFIKHTVANALGRQTLIPKGAAPKRPSGAAVLEQMTIYDATRTGWDGKQGGANRGGIAGGVAGRRNADDADPRTVRRWTEALLGDADPRRTPDGKESGGVSGTGASAQTQAASLRKPQGTGGSADGGIGNNANATGVSSDGGTGNICENVDDDRHASDEAAATAETSVAYTIAEPAGASADPTESGAASRDGVPGAEALPASDTPTEEHPASRLPKLYPIGQMRGTYIIAQNEDGLYLIDQHAAHERIHYEEFYRRFGRPAEASQQLLVPFVLEFTPSEAETLKERLVYFQQAGVYMEHFGGNTFKVTSCPYWFPQGEEKALIEEMAEWILREKKAPDIAHMRDKFAMLAACKASIKANQPLTTAEIETLLERLGNTRNPFTCPHGRPIVISFSNYELEKMFKRVM